MESHNVTTRHFLKFSTHSPMLPSLHPMGTLKWVASVLVLTVFGWFCLHPRFTVEFVHPIWRFSLVSYLLVWKLPIFGWKWIEVSTCSWRHIFAYFKHLLLLYMPLRPQFQSQFRESWKTVGDLVQQPAVNVFSCAVFLTIFAYLQPFGWYLKWAFSPLLFIVELGGQRLSYSIVYSWVQVSCHLKHTTVSS